LHGKPKRAVLGLLAALLVFAAGCVAVYGELWRQGPSSVAPMDSSEFGAAQTVFHHGAAEQSNTPATVRADLIFEAALVTRNAYTLATAPHRLFDAEHCAPAKNSLTLGIPMISMGLLAIPAWLATGDPVLTYNLTLVTMTLAAAFAMYLLVVAWTGRPAAGIVAGLLYAFHPARFQTISHPSVWDSSGTVLALFFAERWLSRGRWRHAVGLVAAIAFQIGASFYPLLAAFFLMLPFAAWLLWRHRLRHVSAAQIGFVVGGVTLAVALLLGPYLAAQSASGEMHRNAWFFAPLSGYLPGAPLFPGWVLLVLAAVALLPRLRPAPGIQGNPVWPLLAGALLVALVAAGPLYEALATVLPGLDAVRVVSRLRQDIYLALAVLAGLGAAALIRRSRRLAPLTAAALVLVAAFAVLRLPALGFERPFQWSYEEIAAKPEDIEFFAELERMGNRGPMLEIPFDWGKEVFHGASRILLATYHHRRTSACFGSFEPPGREELAALADALPKPEAIAALQALGFTTVVAHHPILADPFLRYGRLVDGERWSTRLHSSEDMTAYALEPHVPSRPRATGRRAPDGERS
jgi:hypothetical protein